MRTDNPTTAQELEDGHAEHVDSGVPREGCPACERRPKITKLTHAEVSAFVRSSPLRRSGKV